MAFSEPEKILEQFGLDVGMTVVDLGAGSGFYTIAASKKVMGGRIYAVDIQEGLLSRLKTTIAREHVGSVELIHGDIEQPGGTKLKDDIADAVFICNILFQVENKEGFHGKVFSKEELKNNSSLIVYLYHKAHRGEFDFYIGIEQFILNSLSSK
jgi:predicted RNA methylase